MQNWLGATEIARAARLSRQGVLKRARRERWPAREGRGNGGSRMEFLLSGLPADVQRAVSPDQIGMDGLPEDVKICIGPPRPGNREGALPVVSPNRPAALQRPDVAVDESSSDAAAKSAEKNRWLRLADAPESYREIAQARANALQEWRQRAEALGMTLSEAAAAVPPDSDRDASGSNGGVSASTLWNWKRAYEARGLAGLLPGWEGPDVAIPPEAWDIFRGIWLDLNRPSAQLAYERMLAVYAERVGPDLSAIPGIGAFRRHVGTIPLAAIILYRNGDKAFRDNAEPHLTREYDMPAGDHYVADHHQLDFVARLSNGRPGRFWVTAWADVRSTKYVGWTLCERGSTDSVLASFAAALANGAPLEAWMDNGKDFSSKEVSGMTKRERRLAQRAKRFRKPEVDEGRVKPILAEVGAEAHFSLAFNARAKPIERAFLTLSRRFSKLWPSYVGPNTGEKPATAKRFWQHPELLPGYNQVLTELDKYMLGENARVRRAGRLRGLSADAAWDKFRGTIRAVPADILPMLAMRHTEPVTVQQNGVALFGKFYYSPELIMARLSARVVIRYNPADLGRIWCFDETDGRLVVEVPRSDLAGVTRSNLQAAMAKQRRFKKALRAQYAPAPVDWKIPTTALPIQIGTGASAASPQSGSFDMSALDRELVEGLEKTG